MILGRALLSFAALVILTSACGDARTGSSENSPEEGVDLFDLSLGDCLNDSDLSAYSDFTNIMRVNCETPHDSEVFAILQVDDRSFPGEEEIIAQGRLRCAQAFADFVGVPYSESALDFRFIYPTLSSWSQGDNLIHCLAFDPGLQITGSLIHSKR